MRQLGPGMVQQIQQACSDCNGEGEIIKEKDRCKQCNGKKVEQTRKVLEVHIDKGMKNGQRITFSGEGDQVPDITPGDVVIILEEKPHPIFKRRDRDLIMDQKIPLVTALTGGSFIVTQLDDRKLKITINPGEVIKPGDVKTIMGEGMPTYKNPFEKGNLYINFTIDFPENNWISAEKLVELRKVFFLLLIFNCFFLPFLFYFIYFFFSDQID